jgi:23S rRNA (uridine2552-2'-O)-methyltransferase
VATRRTPKPSLRGLATKLKTAGVRSLSSQKWLQRQLKDPYAHAAKQSGYRSRAAWKLIEIDDRYRLLRPKARIVDLGAAPGGWTQVAAERCPGGLIVAADLGPMEPVQGAKLVQLDILADGAPDAIKAALGGPADLVLTDMAAPSSGHRSSDHLRVIALAEAALAVAEATLAPGGAFLAKILQGGEEKTFIAALRRAFAAVRYVKPAASRKDSAEIYVLATGFRASAPATEEPPP